MSEISFTIKHLLKHPNSIAIGAHVKTSLRQFSYLGLHKHDTIKIKHLVRTDDFFFLTVLTARLTLVEGPE